MLIQFYVDDLALISNTPAPDESLRYSREQAARGIVNYEKAEFHVF